MIRPTYFGALLALLPSLALAHVGLQAADLVAGALHPWMHPDSAIALFGLVLCLIRHMTPTDSKPFVIVGMMLTVGVAAGLMIHIAAPPWPLYAATLCVGLYVCSGFNLRTLPRLITLGFVASLAGYGAGADAWADVKAPLIFLLGTLAGGLIVPLGGAVLVGEPRSGAARLGIRVLGSWLAAVSLMMLALRLRGYPSVVLQ